MTRQELERLLRVAIDRSMFTPPSGLLGVGDGAPFCGPVTPGAFVDWPTIESDTVLEQAHLDTEME